MAEPPSPLSEFGSSGLSRYGGHLTDNTIMALQGSRGRRTFREMADSDPIVGALLFTIDMLIRQVRWFVEPADEEEPQSEEAVIFVDSALNDMDRPFKDIVSEILSMLQYGWAYHELVFKLRQGPDGAPPSQFTDNRIGWHKVAGRNQETLDRWIFDEAGDLLGMVQSAPPMYREVFIPVSKALHFRTTARYNSPEGRSILQNAYRPWYIKKNIENIQAIGVERDLAGLPILGVPAEYLSSDADQTKTDLVNEMKGLLRNIRRDEQEGIIYPLMYDEQGNKLFELGLLSTGGRRQFDTTGIITYYDSRMAMTSMADFILLGHEIHGSFSLSENKTELLSTALAAFMDVIADQFNRRAIPQLLELNGIKMERPPRIMHGDIESLELGQLGTYVQQLFGAGLTFNEPEVVNYLRRQAGIPEKDANL